MVITNLLMVQGYGELNFTRSWFQQLKSFNLTQFLSIRPMDNLFKYGGEMGRHFRVPRYIKVGACDGVSDVFLVNFPKNWKSWEVVLVEPVPSNFEALKIFVNRLKMTNRTSTINAAVLDTCGQNSTIPINIPIIEERYPNLPHWLRRQLASIHSPNMTEMNERLNYHRQFTGEKVRFDRTFDDLYRRVHVPCVAARELTGSWPSLMGSETVTRARYKKKKRTHVLVVDAEGSDAQVVQAMIHQQVPRSLLPLAIFFESKTLNREQVTSTQRALADRGYAFTDFYHSRSAGGDELSNDVFAILLQQQNNKRLQKKKSTN